MTAAFGELSKVVDANAVAMHNHGSVQTQQLNLRESESVHNDREQLDGFHFRYEFTDIFNR